VNNIVYVFGGQVVKDGSVSNELFWMTSERMEWHLQPTRGDRPVGRYGHVAVYDPDHHQLVVFGGRWVSSKLHYKLCTGLWLVQLLSRTRAGAVCL
jgi:hypothetical protein